MLAAAQPDDSRRIAVHGHEVVTYSYGTGDEVVKIIVETPRKLSARQRELLEEFARLSGEDVHPLSKSFLDKVKSLLS